MTAYTPRSVGWVALVVALVLAGCDTSTPTASPTFTGPEPTASAVATAPAAPTTSPAASPTATGAPSASPGGSACDDTVVGGPAATSDANDPNAATYAEIEAQVEAIRGLAATNPVGRGVFDTPGLCAYLRESYRKKNPEDLVRATERLYKELGLLPQAASLEALYLELLTSQVVGLYDDETKRMYVVSQSGGIGPLEEFYYSHEYTHALQDQRFVLRQVRGQAKDQSDRTLARVAVLEGDATLVMTLWAQRHLTPAELSQIVGGIDPGSQAVLDRMPAILKDPLSFPYLKGLDMAGGAFMGGGFEAVNELIATPPDSTEQVLHPDKLRARERPVAVTFPDDLAARLGDGWTVTGQDTFGELLLEIVLREGGATATADAAAGWGGDRVALLEGPGDEVAVVLDTSWDTRADADEFEAALAPTVAELTGLGRSPAVLRPAPDRVVLITAESAATMGRVANVLGLAE